MKPVIQNSFYDEVAGTRGNCMSACIASILELDINDVPNFAQQATDRSLSMVSLIREWLRARDLGLVWIECRPEGEVLEYSFSALCCYFIASGVSPRDPHIQHAVVAWGNDLVHDPHPEGGFLMGYPTFFYFITPYFKPGQDYDTGKKLGGEHFGKGKEYA